MTRMPRSILIAPACFAMACSNPIAAPSGLEMRVTVVNPIVAPSDSVLFITTAYNPTDTPLKVGNACGPSMDVIVTLPSGERRSVVVTTSPGVFTCEGRDYHTALPGETDTIPFRWEAPPLPGRYSARVRARCGPSGPCAEGGSAHFLVRY